MRADDEIRTRDPNLGKVVLYQLSHIRVASSLKPWLLYIKIVRLCKLRHAFNFHRASPSSSIEDPPANRQSHRVAQGQLRQFHRC
ncbi:MAG: hypothetical protein RL167_54 [Actinomycetota bacterium]